MPLETTAKVRARSSANIRNWGHQLGLGFASLDDAVLDHLLGGLGQDAVKKMVSNKRLYGHLAKLAETSGYALPAIETEIITAQPSQSGKTDTAFHPNQIMEAAIAVAACGAMITRDQKMALITSFGEPLIQKIWKNHAALLSRLAAVDFEPLLSAEPQIRAQELDDYNLARSARADRPPFTFKLNKLPFALWDEAYACLNNDIIHSNDIPSTPGLQA